MAADSPHIRAPADPRPPIWPYANAPALALAQSHQSDPSGLFGTAAHPALFAASQLPLPVEQAAWLQAHTFPLPVPGPGLYYEYSHAPGCPNINVYSAHALPTTTYSELRHAGYSPTHTLHPSVSTSTLALAPTVAVAASLAHEAAVGHYPATPLPLRDEPRLPAIPAAAPPRAPLATRAPASPRDLPARRSPEQGCAPDATARVPAVDGGGAWSRWRSLKGLRAEVGGAGPSARGGDAAAAAATAAAPKAKAKRRRKQHVCPLCQKTFPRPSGLKTHMNSHEGIKPFACAIPGCTKTFAVRSNATRHLRTHGLLPPARRALALSFVVDFAPPDVAPATPNAADAPALWRTPGRLRWVSPGFAGLRSGTATPGSSDDGDGDDSGWEDGEDVELDGLDGDAGAPTEGMPLSAGGPIRVGAVGEERSSLAQAAPFPRDSGVFYFRSCSPRTAN